MLKSPYFTQEMEVLIWKVGSVLQLSFSAIRVAGRPCPFCPLEPFGRQAQLWHMCGLDFTVENVFFPMCMLEDAKIPIWIYQAHPDPRSFWARLNSSAWVLHVNQGPQKLWPCELESVPGWCSQQCQDTDNEGSLRLPALSFPVFPQFTRVQSAFMCCAVRRWGQIW